VRTISQGNAVRPGRQPSEAVIRTAFVATYPPRHCGIATFTHDLASVAGGGEVVVLDPPDHRGPYPPEVHHRIRRDEPADYVRAATALGRCRIDVVSVQHEFGIWGGDDGAAVLDFVGALAAPSVVTLHTVLRHPTRNQQRIMVELVGASAATVVMSRSAAVLLANVYGIDPGRVEVIPHGVPNLPLVDPETMKPALGLAGRSVILSFGLLGHGKGYETVLEAMPAVVAAVPDVSYVVLGATHPNLLRFEGEAYRRSLEERVVRLGLTDHVRFEDRFVGRVELGRWLEAADIFVTAYPNLEQIASGTLAYALGAGRAIVSTPYAYASELLADGRGLLVAPGSPAALASAFIGLLRDPERRARLGRRAYDHGRAMIWSQVGATYRELFARVGAGPVARAERATALAPIRV
jgi:glycosyltransferase involved in cell wall biosynthesis